MKEERKSKEVGLFFSSKMLDLSDLCISEGKAVWVLYADIVCLSDDGNVFDAALLAFVSAMQNCKHHSLATFHCFPLLISCVPFPPLQ